MTRNKRAWHVTNKRDTRESFVFYFLAMQAWIIVELNWVFHGRIEYFMVDWTQYFMVVVQICFCFYLHILSWEKPWSAKFQLSKIDSFWLNLMNFLVIVQPHVEYVDG